MNNNSTGFKPNFGLNKSFKPADAFNSIFQKTDPNKSGAITNIDITKLRPFSSHPFKLYEGQRFDDMVESIKESGILLPIIVRPIEYEDDFYEILSGHNRTEAAKVAGFTEIPAIIRKNLTREEALLIVTETNLIQRSFADLSHSERAVTLAMHHDAIKKQGKRTDLINEIENFLDTKNTSENANSETNVQVEQKLNAREKMASDYGLDINAVARYLRINKLSTDLKKRLDNREFGIVPAVEISYLNEQEQKDLDALLDTQVYKLDMKKAAQMREYSEKKILTTEAIEEILSGTAAKKRNRAPKAQKIVIKPKMVAKYFSPDQKSEEIEAEIFEALDFYRANKKATDKINVEAERDEHGDEISDISDDDEAGEADIPESGDG